MLDLLYQIGQSIVNLVESLISMVSWLPLLMDFSSGLHMWFPTKFFFVGTIAIVVMCLKVAQGASNK